MEVSRSTTFYLSNLEKVLLNIWIPVAPFIKWNTCPAYCVIGKNNKYLSALLIIKSYTTVTGCNNGHKEKQNILYKLGCKNAHGVRLAGSNPQSGRDCDFCCQQLSPSSLTHRPGNPGLQQTHFLIKAFIFLMLTLSSHTPCTNLSWVFLLFLL